jgi:excisionase family DNA binding protein
MQGWCSVAEDKVFTVQELASYLRMQPVTIYKHAMAGKLPSFKVGANWRFKKTTIDRWISEQEAHDNGEGRVNT